MQLTWSGRCRARWGCGGPRSCPRWPRREPGLGSGGGEGEEEGMRRPSSPCFRGRGGAGRGSSSASRTLAGPPPCLALRRQKSGSMWWMDLCSLCFVKFSKQKDIKSRSDSGSWIWISGEFHDPQPLRQAAGFSPAASRALMVHTLHR